MDTIDLYNLSDKLYNLVLTLNKDLINPHDLMKCFPVPPSHVKVMFYLRHKNSCSISKIAQVLQISKPNMTPIIDKLIQEGLVNRYNDPSDRRILRIELTEKAHDFFKKQEEKVKERLMEKISSLEASDLENLDLTIDKFVTLVDKLKHDKI